MPNTGNTGHDGGRRAPGAYAVRSASLMLLAAAALFAACSEEVYTGGRAENIPPVLELTQGPVEGDTTLYSVHFYWFADDPDGAVDHYEFCIAEGNPGGFDPADTTGADAWISTEVTDSVFAVKADSFAGNVEIGNVSYGWFEKTHTFFIRAVDDRGASSEVIYRSFTAYTLAPIVVINYPHHANPGGDAQKVATTATFKWYGKDPLDEPFNYQEVDSTRYLWDEYSSMIVRDLNVFPEKFEHRWSDWKSWNAVGDSGRQTTLGDDEMMIPRQAYILAVQAKDEAGAVSTIFSKNTNVRHFIPETPTGPVLQIFEPFLGEFKFLGTAIPPKDLTIPPGFEMNFRWTADASQYGAVVASFRYGWDVADLDDPSQWAVFPSPAIMNAPARTYFSGIHTLYVETVDNLGVKTLGRVEIHISPVVMSRDLLLVDDFPSLDFHPQIYAFPRESEQDEFWQNICIRVKNFDPVQDTWDVVDNQLYLPPMEMLFNYKNVIWNYSTSINPDRPSSWYKLVKYNPEGRYAPSVNLKINYLRYYLALGGHLWTLGESHRNGGLASVLAQNDQVFPCYIRCELFGPSSGCSNTSGENTIAWDNMCVSVLDKVEAIFKTWLPRRDIDRDAMHHAYLDPSDPYVASMAGFPQKLELWDKVTEPGHFFDPAVRGFHYVELYDTDHYMSMVGAKSQSCFHPLYRHYARITRSPLHRQPVAFWYSRHAHVNAGRPGCVAAPSVHFGFPLWFFDRLQADSAATAVFDVWQLETLSDDETRARRLQFSPDGTLDPAWTAE